jgi:predicted DNA-binding mobile mystery protein A
MKDFDDLRIRQLDEALLPFQVLRRRPPPRAGWTRAIRNALGMTLRQMAARAGISETAARSIELNEAKSKVQLNTLQNIADALGCEVVYALVPRTSLREMVHTQAELLANQMIARAADTMELEDQGVSQRESRLQRDAMMNDLLNRRPKHFWDV